MMVDIYLYFLEYFYQIFFHFLICTLVINNKFILAQDTKIERTLKKGEKPQILFKITPALIKDPKKDDILYNYYIQQT